MNASAAPGSHGFSSGVLEWAVGASLLLHLFALMLPQPLGRRQQPEATPLPPLHVRLQSPEPPYATTRRMPAPPLATRALMAPPVIGKPHARRALALAPSVEQQTSQTNDESIDSPPGASASATAPHEAAAVAAAPPDPLALERFGNAVSRQLATRQQYPKLAALRGWEGEVRLRVHIATKGNIVSIQLVQSSGFDLLDQSAIKLVETCGELPPLPEALRGRDFDILIPVQYRLAKAG